MKMKGILSGRRRGGILPKSGCRFLVRNATKRQSLRHETVCLRGVWPTVIKKIYEGRRKDGNKVICQAVYCTDNGAMVAATVLLHQRRLIDLTLNAAPLRIDGLVKEVT